MGQVGQIGGIGGFGGPVARDDRAYDDFWHRDLKIRQQRQCDYQHLLNLQVGGRTYNLSNKEDFQDFEADILDGCLDGKIGPPDGSIIIRDGHVHMPGGKVVYDIRKPADVQKMKADAADGKLDGKVGSPAAAKDDVEKPPAGGAGAQTSEPVRPPTGSGAASTAGINFDGLSWDQIIVILLGTIAEKEIKAKKKIKELNDNIAATDADSAEGRENSSRFSQEIAEVNTYMKQLDQLVNLLTNMQKQVHEMNMVQVRAIGA